MIPVFRPSITDKEIKNVEEVMRSGWLGMGPKTSEFEEKFAKYIGAKYVVGLNSCTSALDLALKLIGINEGDEVILPSMTFVSTGHCVMYNNGTPVFVDVDNESLNIDFDKIVEAINPNTKAIIVVHFGGRPVDVEKLKTMVGDIPIVEDCAHASGAEINGKKCGTLGDIGCFSFQAVKNLCMGDGGAVSLNSDHWNERARKLRWLGIDKGTWTRTASDKSYWWDYNVDEVGYKIHMNDILASIGIAQLERLDEMNRRREEIVHHYHKRLSEIASLKLGQIVEGSSNHIFYVRIKHRDQLAVFLKENEISTGVHYRPIHFYKCFNQKISLPISENAFDEILTLPIFPDLTEEQQDHICNKVIEFFKKL